LLLSQVDLPGPVPRMDCMAALRRPLPMPAAASTVPLTPGVNMFRRTLLLPLLLAACAHGGDHSDSGQATHDGGSADDSGALDTSREQPTDGGTWMVSYAPTPDPLPFSENFDLLLTLTDSAGGAVAGAETVLANATMPSHGHGMNVEPVATENEDGTWTASPFKFHMAGMWEITVDVTADGSTERASFNVECCPE
jgi:YtkA-like